MGRGVRVFLYFENSVGCEGVVVYLKLGGEGGEP